jgi:soluble lytic murein transglycosylase-like protein
VLPLVTDPSSRQVPTPEVPVKARAAHFHVPASMERWARVPYKGEILAAAAFSQVDPLLLVSVIEVESGFRAHAVSQRGAVGLMQVLPRTARDYGEWDLVDPGDNLKAGSRHLAGLLARFEGNLPLALAAYNAGTANVLRHGGVPPFPETREYVQRVLSRYEPAETDAAA